MGYVRSNMSIIAPELVNIEIAALADHHKSRLRLNYQGGIYDLVQAFASNKLERAEQKRQQLMGVNGDSIDPARSDRYLLVQEVGYYSLWELDRSALKSVNQSISSQISSSIDLAVAKSEATIELQQASIWLLQELWVQWQELLGARQVQVFADNLLSVTPQLDSGEDLDRLLSLDPLAPVRLESWSKSDLITFDRQLYHLTQKKIGQQFGTKLTLDIIQSMPDSLRSILSDILGI
jgi:hypothetical protein